MSRITRLRLFAVMLCALLSAVSLSAQIVEVGDGGPGPVKAQHLTAELTALSPNVAIGGETKIGLNLSLEEHWHVYWVNAGDSGNPPKITWTAPKGVTVGPLQFPPPTQLPLGPLMDFGYEDTVTFPITVTVAPSVKPGKIHLDGKVSWLVCAQVCLPGRAHLGIDLNAVAGPVADAPLVGALGTAITNLPKPLPANMSVAVLGGAKHIVVTLTGGGDLDATFFPFDQEVISNSADEGVGPHENGIRFHLVRDPNSTALPKTLHGLIKLSDTEAYEFTAPVVPGELPESSLPKQVFGGGTSGVTIFGAIGLAFLGGILLNLMPCVFPVLFLKGLALVNSSGEEKSRQRAHGLVYTLGIVVSFWAVVAALLVLRAGGQQLGWGFQLQSPGFIAVLASLVFFLALSLAGQFELGLSLTSAGGELAQKQGFAGSFFTGVLATIVATPCTGPLMGAAVGYALAQPPFVTFVIFTSLALGLAAPYLALTMQPQWTRVLPKPGAWMEVLKQASSVPLFATAIWLTWVYAHLYGKDGIDKMVALLACYLILAMAGWALGRWPAKWGSAIAAVLLIVVAVALPLRKITVETLHWEPYTEESFAAARATGHPVFIDFTAAWCLSCQVNERAVLQSAEVDATLLANHVVLLRADWTQYDPAITNRLATLGRSGVPTYVIYPGGTNSNPDVLPELLTKDLVLKQLEKDVKLGTK